MSTDDIVFSDVTYREPERRRRPDRDRRWACLAYEVPGPDDLLIFLDRGPADAIERHALSDTSVELGGILLGKECVDDETGEPFVWVTRALEAKHFENTQASFTYTHDSWEEISRERDRLHPDLDIVGWYHTHPDFGVFLSGHDLFIHRHFFAQPLQVAYVVDPIRQTRGFFRWRDGGLEEVGGYYVTAERGDRISLARLVNDLEGLPAADGGGSLSPRLEAELIAMLTRPHQAPAAVADRAQVAATFGLLGALAGGLGLALLMWLYTLGHQVQAQGERIREIAEAVKPTAEDQHRRDIDDARVGGKEAALDALLEKVRVDGANNKASITRLLVDARAERDEAVKDARKKAAIYEQFAEAAVKLREETKKREEDLAKATKKLDEYEKEAKGAKELRESLEKSAEEVATLQRDNAAKARRLKDLEDVEKGRMIGKYYRAWYAAVAGWTVGLVLGVGLIAARTRGLPTGIEDDPGPEETHQIG